MSTSETNSYTSYCEFSFGIKLNVPIVINPIVSITSSPALEQRLPIYLAPDLYLKPEVSATPPVCLPQNGHHKAQLPTQQTQQTQPQQTQQTQQYA